MACILYAFYLLSATGLALFSLNYMVTAWLYWRKRAAVTPVPTLETYPRVTVQLPVYDELYVVERLIDAAAALDWPQGQLQIQVLDDSEDETTAVAQARVDYWQRRGIHIIMLRRADRTGFKAGALAAALPYATGEFIAIFDADFVPPADFLKRTIPHFLTGSDVGLVQTRWGHLNANYSALTRAQALALDSHFIVEQIARSRNGLFMNFNGTAGVWRRECIDDAGGWHTDTLTEDLDLSYRAQLRGWKFDFLPDVVAPAEVPPQLHAFKRQQFRWAKGSTQCLLKLGPRVACARDLSLLKRVEGLLHLSGYLMNPLMLLLLLALVPLIAFDTQFPQGLAVFSLSILGPLVLYGLAQSALYPNWAARMRYFPLLTLIGIGMAFNDSLAVWQGLTGQGSSSFRRTPKFRVESDQDAWSGKRYALPFTWEAAGELLLAAYAVFGVSVAWQHDLVWSIPFLLLYAGGLGYVAALSLWHSRPARAREIELASAN